MKKSLLRSSILLALLCWGGQQLQAFCGFYVAKADATLFNKSSQVIIVRDGDRTVITMSSDYQGDAKDFAMVVPVPEVLQESDIRVVQQYIFTKFDSYTAPRLVEYWDPNPCQRYHYGGKDMAKSATNSGVGGKGDMKGEERSKALGVTVEAKYTIGEYDILLLSALESTGLKTWLTENGYKIPKGADEVLDPYIKDGMKFFVVKVNLEQQAALGLQTLRPLQIQFSTSKFMLPIRLGMANATGPQDMIVYAFTRKGRVETSNYRSTLLPTNREIPEFIQTDNLFGGFYKAVYEKAWAKEGKNSVMLEYAWDVSGRNPVKCDPCVTSPITYAELKEAGIWWVEPGSSGGYLGDLYVTRLHVRYSRKTFPQDLMFLNTSDNTQFQGRYIVRHAPQGSLDCEAGKQYKANMKARHQRELAELAALTGWNTGKWASYAGGTPSVQDPNIRKQPEPTPVLGTPTPQPGTEVPADSVVAASVDSGSITTGSLADEAESVATSEKFLQPNVEASKPFLSTKGWLFLLAGAMFLTGILVRLLGRKGGGKPNA